MKQVKGCLLSIVLWLCSSVISAHAQDTRLNSIEAMTVAQQGNVVNVKMTFKTPLSELPSGFSVAKPARIALDFPNVENGLGSASQIYNEGALKSANIIQADGRTRVVLNLNQAMTYETAIDGNALVLSLSPSTTDGGVAPRIEHFSQANPS